MNISWKTIEAREKFILEGVSHCISKTSTSKKFQIHHQKVPLKRKPGISEASSISTTTRSPSYIIVVGRVTHCQARPCQLLQMLAAQRRWCSSWVRGILATGFHTVPKEVKPFSFCHASAASWYTLSDGIGL